MSKAATPHKCTDVERLQRVIQNIEWQAQEAFSEIKAVARLALLALENPRTHQAPELIASALSAIWEKAEIAEDGITTEADSVGCTQVNTARLNRSTAREQWLSGVLAYRAKFGEVQA